MENYLILAVVAILLLGATVYIIRAKKKGTKCIGCPNPAQCTGDCPGCKK